MDLVLLARWLSHIAFIQLTIRVGPNVTDDPILIKVHGWSEVRVGLAFNEGDPRRSLFLFDLTDQLVALIGHRKIRMAGCVHCVHIHGLACTCMAHSLRA